MPKLDETMAGVQNTAFMNIYHDLIRQSLKQTHFTETELNCILMLYHKFVVLNGPKAKEMTKSQFSHLYEVMFEVYDVQIIQRISVVIARESKNYIPAAAWVKLFSIFMSDSLDEKMQFVFNVYNLHESNYLDREVVIKFVVEFFQGDDEDEINEYTADMVDLLFRKFDLDRDNLISYEEYAAVVRKTPMLLEFLGTCLPSYDGLTVAAYCTDFATRLTHLKSCL